MEYCRVVNSAIVFVWPGHVKTVYIPEDDKHIGRNEFEAYGIFKATRDNPDLAPDQVIDGYTLKVVSERPVYVANIVVRQSVVLGTNEIIDRYERQEINGVPTDVPVVRPMTPEEIIDADVAKQIELQAWREQAVLPRHMALRALRKAGKKNAIQQAINEIPVVADRDDAQEAYDNAPYFSRLDSLVLYVWAASGGTPEELDDLFRAYS